MNFCREIGAQAEDFHQFVVRAGAGDDGGKALVGKPGAGVVGELSDHLGFAAVDDDVGDGRRARSARPEMASR